MEQLAILLRSIQLYSQNVHNLAKGSLFFADHDFLGALYEQADAQYDSVIERMIGLDMSPNLANIQLQAANLIKDKPHSASENKIYFKVILEMYMTVCQLIQQLVKDPNMSEGTKQLIGDIADKAEMNKYKLKQRCK